MWQFHINYIKSPNRDAKFLRGGFVLSQVHGEGPRIMERQQELASKEAYKEHLLKQIAINTGGNLSDLRQSAHTETQNERVTIMLRPNLEQVRRPEPSTNIDQEMGDPNIDTERQSISSLTSLSSMSASPPDNNINIQHFNIQLLRPNLEQGDQSHQLT